MTTNPLVPIVGDIWEEKARPGRTVLILKVEWRTYHWGQRKHEVLYKTLTTPNKRPQSMPSVVEMASFQKRFRRHFPGLHLQP